MSTCEESPNNKGRDKCEPLFKWAGGKRALLPQILPLVPKKFSTYFEPFLGGAAMFFALRPEVAVLSDVNPELVNCYQQVRAHPDDVIRFLGRLTNEESQYYAVRRSKPRADASRAARFLYLVTLSFNGLYRLNRAGDFNVPYGWKTHLSPCDAAKIRAISTALRGTRIRRIDFGKALRQARQNDFVYLDPPYTVAHGNNGFLKYNAKIFSWDDQRRLAKLAQKLADRGCHVMISNADHDSILELYDGFKIHRLHRASVMAADAAHRGNTTECLFTT